MPVQAIYKFTSHGDERRIVAGRIESGQVAVGDEVVFSPSNKSARVASIEAFNAAARTEISAGWSTGFTLSEEIYITRGEVMSRKDHAPLVGTRFRANLIWLGRKPMVQGRDYKLKLAHLRPAGADPAPAQGPRRLAARWRLAKDAIGRHDVADVVLETRQPVAFDLTTDIEGTGRFVIVDGYDVAGGGIITAGGRPTSRTTCAARRACATSRGSTAASPLEERAKRFGHRPALVMFVGRHSVGKHRYARALERALFDHGVFSYFIDGTNVLMGVDHDLTVTPPRPSWCAASARWPTCCSPPGWCWSRPPMPSASPTTARCRR